MLIVDLPVGQIEPGNVELLGRDVLPPSDRFQAVCETQDERRVIGFGARDDVAVARP